jgi:uncharacterized protein (DUF1330 family)
MNKTIMFFLGTIFGLLLSGLVVTAIANTQTEKAYLVVSGELLTDEGMEAYREKAGPVAQKAGIKIIARNEQVDSDSLLEGDWEHEGFLAIEEFSSMDALKTFWFSPEYQEAIKLRQGKVKLDFVVAVKGQ